MDLKGKDMIFLGDSITAGVGVSDPRNIYWRRFEPFGGMLYGYGVDGTCIARLHGVEKDEGYFAYRLEQIPYDADIVVIFGGTNDLGCGTAPFGRMSDRTPDTFYGALHDLFTRAINKYPNATIVVLTSIHRDGEESLICDRNVRNVGVLTDYINAEKEVAAYYGLPVLDLYRLCTMPPHIPVIREKYIPDGLHPNDAGHAIIHSRLKGFLESL